MELPSSRMDALVPHFGYLSDLMRSAVDEYSQGLQPGVQVINNEPPQIDPSVNFGGSYEQTLQSSIDRDRIRLAAMNSDFPKYVLGEIPEFTQSAVASSMESRLQDLIEEEITPISSERQRLLDSLGATDIRLDPTGRSKGAYVTFKNGSSANFLALRGDLGKLVEIDRNMDSFRFKATERALGRLVGKDGELGGMAPLFNPGNPGSMRRVMFETQRSTLDYLRNEWTNTDRKIDDGLRSLRENLQTTQAASLEQYKAQAAKTRLERQEHISSTERRIRDNIRLMREMRSNRGRSRTVGFG